MNNATRLRRLNHFVAVLEAVPVKKFRMSHFLKENYFDNPLHVTVPANFIQVKCQTAGCGLGWAALDKTFRKAGLRVKSEEFGLEIYGNVFFKDEEGIGAGAGFFGITRDEAEKLFLEVPYRIVSDKIKPRHVIAKVKKLIKKYEVGE